MRSHIYAIEDPILIARLCDRAFVPAVGVIIHQRKQQDPQTFQVTLVDPAEQEEQHP
jgi:hypothetical protein